MDFNKTRYIPMSRRRRIYEGKAKVLYEGPEPGTLIQHFKDDATAFNAKKHQVIEGKGVLNNRISEYLFQHLNDIGVPTHFIRRDRATAQIVAIGEAARHHHEVGAFRQRGLRVPHHCGLVAGGELQRARHVAFAVDAGKDEDG